MTKTRIFCIGLVALLILSGTLAVLAQAPQNVYVDPDYSGNEVGTQAQPYNTIREGEGAARTSASGGTVYTKQADGTWEYHDYYPFVESGREGVPLPQLTLYLLLAVLALALILVGWQLRRRGYQLRH